MTHDLDHHRPGRGRPTRVGGPSDHRRAGGHRGDRRAHHPVQGPSVPRRSPSARCVVAGIAGLPVAKAVASYTKGFGDTAAGVGTLIALGAMFGKLLADSGGADQIVDTIVGRSSTRTLPWAMALVGALIGLPMFFEIGLVLLMPVIFLVARRSGLSLIGRHPGAGRPVGDARAGTAAPRPAGRDRRAEGQPRHHAGPRRAGRDPHGGDRRAAVRPLRRPLGRRPGPAPVRRRRDDDRASDGGPGPLRRTAPPRRRGARSPARPSR